MQQLDVFVASLTTFWTQLARTIARPVMSRETEIAEAMLAMFYVAIDF